MKKMTWLKASIVASCLFTAEVSATTLTEALVQAYNTNPSLTSAQEQLKRESEKINIAFASFLPDIKAVGQRTKTQSTVKESILPAGNKNKSDMFTQRNAIELTQPLFRGGASVLGLKIANQQFDLGVATYKKAEQDFLLTAIKTYAQLIYSKEALEISRNSVNRYKKNADSVKRRLEVGEATRTDMAESNAYLAKAEAEQVKAESDYAKAVSAYKAVVGIEPTNLVNPEESQDLPPNINDATNIAVINNFDVNIAKINYEMARNIALQSKTVLAPQVSLNALVEDVKRPSPNYGSNSKQRSLNKQAMINVSMDLYNGGSDFAKIRTAAADLSKFSSNYEYAKTLAINSVIEEWNNLESAYAEVKARTTQVESAQVALDGMVKEEAVGTRTILDVLDMEDKLFNAKLSLSNAINKRLVASYSLKQALGTLTAEQLKLPTTIFNTNEYKDQVKFFHF
jgi:TolC family type I secretion outer membrane protein